MKLFLGLCLLLPVAALADESRGDFLPAALYGRVSPSIVVVESTLAHGGMQGSGVVVGPELVVTNHHVIDGAVGLQIRQGKRSWPATLEAFNPKHDLALLRVAGLDLPRVSMRPSTLVTVGERVFVLGAPRGLELSLSDGLVAALRREKDTGPARIQTTAPASPGSSGGGLFDSHGQLIGIITFSADGQNLNFAHPTEWIQELRAHGASPLPVADTRAHRYGVATRPEQLSCRLDTEATWALFSGGAEILESTPIQARWSFYRLSSQTPQSVPQLGGGFPTEDLVLHDLNRSVGMVSFVPASAPKIERVIYFTVDDDEKFRVTILAPFDFHGQVRVRAESGPCVPPPPRIEVKAAPENDEERCQRGQVAACITLARLTEPRDRVGALKLFMRGCEQAHSGDSAKVGAESCESAAKICDVLGYTTRAIELRTTGKNLSAAK